MKEAYWIHRDCRPQPGREDLAAARDKRLSADPRDPFRALHWIGAYDGILEHNCGICGQKFCDFEPVTGFSLDS